MLSSRCAAPEIISRRFGVMEVRAKQTIRSNGQRSDVRHLPSDETVQRSVSARQAYGAGHLTPTARVGGGGGGSPALIVQGRCRRGPRARPGCPLLLARGVGGGRRCPPPPCPCPPQRPGGAGSRVPARPADPRGPRLRVIALAPPQRGRVAPPRGPLRARRHLGDLLGGRSILLTQRS